MATNLIRITNDDLLRILAGRTLTVEKNTEIRLYTADELLEEHRKVTDKYNESPTMTYAQAAQLTRSVDLFELLKK